jgi:tetratricopeptide (TPR) repeat protein
MTFSRLAATAVAGVFGVCIAGFTAPLALAKGEAPPPDKCGNLTKGSPEWKRCTRGVRDDLSDQELFAAGYWLAKTGNYADAVDFLNKVRIQDERVLTYLGFATRKLGDHRRALDLYGRALALNPDYVVARAYLGEAHLTQGDVGAARRELAEIAVRCGTGCAEHVELAAEIAKAARERG